MSSWMDDAWAMIEGDTVEGKIVAERALTIEGTPKGSMWPSAFLEGNTSDIPPAQVELSPPSQSDVLSYANSRLSELTAEAHRLNVKVIALNEALRNVRIAGTGYWQSSSGPYSSVVRKGLSSTEAAIEALISVLAKL